MACVHSQNDPNAICLCYKVYYVAGLWVKGAKTKYEDLERQCADLIKSNIHPLHSWKAIVRTFSTDCPIKHITNTLPMNPAFLLYKEEVEHLIPKSPVLVQVQLLFAEENLGKFLQTRNAEEFTTGYVSPYFGDEYYEKVFSVSFDYLKSI